MQAEAFGRLRSGQVLVAGMFSDTPPRRRAAEDLARSLKQAGITPRLFDLATSLGRPLVIAVPNAYLERELAELTVADVIILAPPVLTGAAAALLRGRLSGMQRLIAFWNGPLDEPAVTLREAASGLDAIWAPTACLAEIALAALPDFAGGIDIVDPRRPAPPAAGEDRAACRARFGLPNSAFVVGAELAIEDALDGQNPAGTLAAFTAAFDDDPDAFLVLRCDCPEALGDDFAALLRTAAHPRIRVIDTRRHYLPCASLLRAVDTWLALPRDAADRAGVDDALGAGLQVIACARGLSAARWKHPALHPVRYARAAENDGTEWVTPDIAHAATLLRGLRRRGLHAA